MAVPGYLGRPKKLLKNTLDSNPVGVSTRSKAQTPKSTTSLVDADPAFKLDFAKSPDAAPKAKAKTAVKKPTAASPASWKTATSKAKPSSASKQDQGDYYLSLAGGFGSEPYKVPKKR